MKHFAMLRESRFQRRHCRVNKGGIDVDGHVSSIHEGNSGAAQALAPQPLSAFHEFSRQTFAEGALSARVKRVIAVAVADTTQCPYYIRGHRSGVLGTGASLEEIMEAIWIAPEMRAGAAYAHSTIALDAMQEYIEKQR